MLVASVSDQLHFRLAVDLDSVVNEVIGARMAHLETNIATRVKVGLNR